MAHPCASRCRHSSPYSSLYPFPPCSSIASPETRLAISLAVHLARDTSSGSGSPVPAVARGPVHQQPGGLHLEEHVGQGHLPRPWNSMSGFPNCMRC